MTVLLSSCVTEITENSDWIEITLTPKTFSESTNEYLDASYEVFIPAYSALEYKIDMLEGDSIVYSWNVEMTNPEQLTAEFHGHTEKVENQPGTVMFYKIHNEGKGSGALIAPFSGIHGWYLNNESDEDIVVQLDISGFYTAIQQ